ncbi:NAD(P)-binding domain-containing protein [Streptomyces sp. NPDC088253]
MARSLLRTGLGVRVWNRTQSKAAPLAADGATVTETAEEAVRGADVIVTMLNDGLSVAAALTAAASGVHGGQILLQSSTVGPDATADLAQRAADLGLVGLYAAHLAGQNVAYGGYAGERRAFGGVGGVGAPVRPRRGRARQARGAGGEGVLG